MAEESRFHVPIEELEAAVRVAAEDRVVAVPRPPGEAVVPPEELDRARALSPTGDFRLRP